jgi:class 3 adenylate cyclase/tetratricopeptide (TPR) repeat protein
MDLEVLLRSLGLERYEASFRENAIDDSVLPSLTAEDLKDVGVGIVGHRRKLLDAIAALRADANAKAAPPDALFKNTAERRQLTVMFCDLVGSTALSTRIDPEDMRDIIGTYHRCCAQVIAEAAGFVARYMGDGVLAYFGYPQAHEDDAERAVRAGLGLITAVTKLDVGAETTLRVRVGIATGLVVVGDLIGAGASRQHEVVGETPNLAARLQALAEPDTVVIAGNTRSLLGELFEYRAFGSVTIKGFGDPVPVWQVTGASATASRFEALRATRTPLVGRDEEIELLMRRWQQARAGDGCVVLISGEAGIGKSRLAETILERLSGEPHIRLRYYCSPHHEDSAFYPAISQLERAAAFRREDTAAQRLDKVEAVLGLATGKPREAAPLLASLLSIPTGDRYPPMDLCPQKQKEKTLNAFVAQVVGLAARQPVLIVVEDAHWSDPSSRDLFDLIVDRVSTLPVLVIVTFRPEFAPPWVGRAHVTLLSLNRLRPRERAAMISRVAGGKALPGEVTEQIMDRTDGVPLFIEELTKAVMESGVLMDAGDRWTMAGPLPPFAIPTSLHASLLARLDRLATAREAAQIAAALGRQFSHELISAVAPMPQQQLDDSLAQLVAAELMFRRGTPPNAEYTFKHALVQDAAYSTVLRSRRQQLHAHIATILESRFPEIVAAQPQLVARHCAEAGLNEKAVGYWLKAGRQAVTRSAMTEAVAQLQKGLSLLATLPDGPWRQQQELDLRFALGQAQTPTRGYAAPEVMESLARARVLAEQLDRPDYLMALLHGQWLFHLVRAEYELALSHAEQMEKTGKARNDATMLVSGRHKQGVTRFFLGEFTGARTLLEQCQGLRDAAHSGYYIDTLCFLAVTLVCLGYVEQGRTLTNQALSEARRLKRAHTLATALLFMCRAGWLADSPHDMQRHAEELVALSNEHSFSLWLGGGMIYHGWSLTALGQVEEGVASLTQGLAVSRATGAVQGTPVILTSLAQAYAKLGRLHESQACLAEAGQIIEATDERWSEAEFHRVRGDVLNIAGDRAAAEQNYHLAFTVAQRQSAKLFELRAATSLARIWHDQGNHIAARELLAPVYRWFTEGFDSPVLKEAKALLDQLA